MKILIAGDFCPRGQVADLINSGDFKAVLAEVNSYIQTVDYSIVNLECPVVERTAQPIDKCGPNLRCSRRAIEALKWTGFDAVSLANNHFFDFGQTGVEDTLDACKEMDMRVMGGVKMYIKQQKYSMSRLAKRQ